MSSFIHFRSSCFQEETRASPSFECLPQYFLAPSTHVIVLPSYLCVWLSWKQFAFRTSLQFHVYCIARYISSCIEACMTLPVLSPLCIPSCIEVCIDHVFFFTPLHTFVYYQASTKPYFVKTCLGQFRHLVAATNIDIAVEWITRWNE